MDLNKFNNQIFFATVRIVVPTANSIGTGFTFEAPLPLEGHALKLLISNRHVFKGAGHKAQLTFHRSKIGPDGTEADIGNTVVSDIDLNDPSYVDHPDPNVDLACLNVAGINDPKHCIYHKSLPSSMISDFDPAKLFAGSNISFIGYPDGRYDTVNNLPSLRTGTIATIPQIEFGGHERFVVDA